jgi:signal transduction histidine kinase
LNYTIKYFTLINPCLVPIFHLFGGNCSKQMFKNISTRGKFFWAFIFITVMILAAKQVSSRASCSSAGQFIEMGKETVCVSALSIILALALTYYFTQHITKRKISKEICLTLDEKETMRAHYLEKITSILERERKRISMELHDETSQSLTTLLLVAKLIQETDDLSEVHKLAGNMREIIYKTLEEIQRLSYELRPGTLDDEGLYTNLRNYIQNLSRYTDLNIEYNLQACKSLDIGLTPAVKTMIFRIVQEALTNVIRHAEAQNVKVLFRCNNRTIEATIEDDGRGFDLASLQKDRQALGLSGMTERASLAGGELLIETGPGKGTSVILKIPRECE